MKLAGISEIKAAKLLKDKGNKIFQSIASLQKLIVLEGYTRDPWALDTTATKWTPVQVESVDGRNKLPGFVDYLHERKKR